MGILDRLAGSLDELVSAAPGDAAPDVRGEIELARALAERGQVEEALERLSDLGRLHPRDPSVLEARGSLLRSLGRLDEAALDFGRAVDLDADRPSAWVELGETLAELGRLEPARDALRRALTRTTLQMVHRQRALHGLGRVHERMGQHPRAIRELRKLVALAPEAPEGIAALGRALLTAGEATEGAEWLTRAARLPGGDVAMLVEAARVKAAAMSARPGDAERTATDTEADPALRLLREAVERAPTVARVRSALARRLAELEQPAAARREAEAEASMHPDDPESWSALREVHARAGDFAAAIVAAARQGALGSPIPFAEGLRLALGARDPVAIGEALSRAGEIAGESEPGYREARAFQAGTADFLALRTLSRLAPDDAARRFVVASLSPSAVPRGNVLGLLAWARDFAIRRAGDMGQSDLASALLSVSLPLSRALEAFDRPLLLAVMGEFNAGKSSLVNALAGATVARVGVTPTTATINILRYGLSSGGRVRFHDGAVRDLRTDQMGSYLANLDDAETARIRLIEIFSPTDSLQRIEIVDTPGLNSLRAEHERVAREFLAEADAVIWVFALGQAAKASERDALDIVHVAGKQVLGVINKIDGADPGDVDAVMAHVTRELGDRVARLLPFSARLALRARQTDNDDELSASGLDAVETALEQLFYRHARQLKRATALGALHRFVIDTRVHIDAASSALTAAVARLSRERAVLHSTEVDIRSTLAAERVALRARIDRAMRAIAPDVREFGRPRAWPFGEQRLEAGQEADLADLLDDAVGEAVAASEQSLQRRVDDPMAEISAATRAELHATIAVTAQAFAAYVRGGLEGAAAMFFRVDASRTRLELPALSNLLARYAPDPERRLFHELDARLRAVFDGAHAALDADCAEMRFNQLVLEELVTLPLASFEAALDVLPDSELTSRQLDAELDGAPH